MVTAAVVALALAVPFLFAGAFLRGQIHSHRPAIAGIVLWLAAGWVLVLTGRLDSASLGFPAFVPPVVVTVLVGTLLLRSSHWRRAVDSASMEWLLATETLRLSGGLFIYMASRGLLPVDFGYPVGRGDMIAGAFALAALASWRGNRPYRRGLAMSAMIVGMLDAANSLRHALAVYPSTPALGQFPFGLLFVSAVPLLVLTHIYVLFKLLVGTYPHGGGSHPAVVGFDGPRQRPGKIRAGDPTPRFEAETLEGLRFTDRDLHGRWTLLTFHRYAACPVCNLALRDYTRRHPELRQAGLHLVAVFHSPRERLLEYLPPDLPFTILSDPAMALYERFGAGTMLGSLVDPRSLLMAIQSVGAGSFNLLDADGPGHTVPSEFVIDPRGLVRYARHGTYPGDLLSVDDMVRLVSRLQTEPAVSRGMRHAGQVHRLSPMA